VPERLQQMASHESPRTTKFYDQTKGQGMLRWRGRATHVSARSLILSTLITGLDGRSNFERNGGALAPLLHLPLAILTVFAPSNISYNRYICNPAYNKAARNGLRAINCPIDRGSSRWTNLGRKQF
jgi:hypothetical protein